MVTFFLSIAFTLSLVFLCTIDGDAQIVSTKNNCEENESLLSVYSGTSKEGTRLIFIARPGVKEKSLKYSSERLLAIKQNELRGFKENQLVFGVGIRSKANPQVEVYVNGKLELIFEVPNKQQIKVGNCQN